MMYFTFALGAVAGYAFRGLIHKLMVKFGPSIKAWVATKWLWLKSKI